MDQNWSSTLLESEVGVHKKFYVIKWAIKSIVRGETGDTRENMRGV